MNFTSAIAANMVGEILRDYKWGAFKDVNGGTVHSWKVCEITWARSQVKYYGVILFLLRFLILSNFLL